MDSPASKLSELAQTNHGLLSSLHLYFTGNDEQVLISLFLLQGIIALAVTVIGLFLLPKKYRPQWRKSGLYLFIFSLVVPFGALLVCLPSIWLARRFPVNTELKDIAEVALPTFVPQLVSRVKHGGGARLRVQLENAAAPVAERMAALVAIQAMQKRTASPILRGLLSDSVEDVRLLVYGMLDGAEKEITQQIHTAFPALAAASNDAELCAANHRLADLYWELIYQNLVQDDIYRYTAEQAEKYAFAALTLDHTIAPLWYMRGRLALMRGVPDLAEGFLKLAGAYHFPHDRLLPRLAEAAYLRGDYQHVRSAFLGFRNQSMLPSLKPLQLYWTS